MAIRKMSDLYFPEHYRLMLDDGKWFMYNTQMCCAVDVVDRRFAIKLVKENHVGKKHIDALGRIMFSWSDGKTPA